MTQNETMYYLKLDGETIVSVCIIKDMEKRGMYHRGIAVKSPTDQDSRFEGRRRALGRARRAMKRGASSSLVKTTRTFRRISEVGIYDTAFMRFKSAFCCKLTPFEKTLVDAMEQRMGKDA